MKTLARAVRQADAGGESLPVVYPNLDKAGINFRTKVVSMIAGQSGSYKSTLGLNILARWAKQGVTSLYISAEDDSTIVASRIAAMVTGEPMEYVSANIRTGAYSAMLKEIDQYVGFEFRALRVPQIAERMEAFSRKHGPGPRVLWIDNLMSMVEDPTDYHGQMMFVRDMAQIAATYPSPCAVIIMHHTREHPENLRVPKLAPAPPPKWEIHGKVSQFPKLILTIDTAPPGETPDRHMAVAAVKNNYGPSDHTGRDYEDFWVTPENARITEMSS